MAVTGHQQENTSEFVVSLSLKSGQVTLQNESIQEIYFIEDIFNYCVTGKIRFYDKYGVFELGPITGNEKINIIYGEEEDSEWSFNIYKISKVSGDSSTEQGTKQTIDLFFVDNMFYPLNFIKFSKSYKNEKITNIVTDIAENLLGVTKWDLKENSSNKTDYYSPYWTAKDNIHWLLTIAKGQESGKPGYCFFNNSKGTNLVTLDKLLGQSKLLTLATKDDGIYVFEESENLFLFNKILSWEISGINHDFKEKLAGETLLGYNTLEKKFIVNTYNYKDSLKKHTILGEYSLFNDISEERKGYKFKGENNINTLDNMFYGDWNKLYDHQQIVSIVVRGHEARHCGKIIEIKWPSFETITEKYNKKLQGKYLIKSVTHYFSGYNTPSYSQKLNLIKNGYEETEVTELEKSTLRNLS